MVEPISVALGSLAALVALLALTGVYQTGYRRSRAPDHVVDMNEVESYYRRTHAAETLDDQRDVE